jgi:hypothetical protein
MESANSEVDVLLRQIIDEIEQLIPDQSSKHSFAQTAVIGNIAEFVKSSRSTLSKFERQQRKVSNFEKEMSKSVAPLEGKLDEVSEIIKGLEETLKVSKRNQDYYELVQNLNEMWGDLSTHYKDANLLLEELQKMSQ